MSMRTLAPAAALVLLAACDAASAPPAKAAPPAGAPAAPVKPESESEPAKAEPAPVKVEAPAVDGAPAKAEPAEAPGVAPVPAAGEGAPAPSASADAAPAGAAEAHAAPVAAAAAAFGDAAKPGPGPARIERGNLVLEAVPETPPAVRERLIQFQNVRSASFSDWAAGGGILIATRFGETSQVHHVAQPMGARRQLTFYDEPVGGADASPDGAQFVFGKDTGGDEFFQGWLMPLKGGVARSFTAPGTRNGALIWSDDGGKVAWYRSTAKDPDWDIMAGDPRNPAVVKVVLEGQGAMTPTDWSSDGSKLLVSKYVSVAKSHRYVLDMASGALSEVAADKNVSYDGGELLPEAKAFLATTDEGSEFRRLAIIDTASGAADILTPDIKWDVESFKLSPDAKTVVFSINAAGVSEIKLLDLASRAIRNGPDIPKGIVGGFEFTPDSKSVGFTLNASASPGDVYSFDVASLALTRWTESEIGGLDPARFVEPELVTLSSFDGLEISAFVYRPKSAGPHPVIVSIHGGPEGQARPGFSSTIQYWASELGIAVVTPNVRGSDGYGKTFIGLDNGMKREDSVKDIGAILDWIAADPGLDASRVLVYGGSYGGYMVLAAMTHYSDRLVGGVNIVGISNFVTFLENTMGYRRDLRRAEYGDERDPAMRAFLEKISPLSNVSKITKPLFIIQGLNDPRVPASEADQILAGVRANGGEAWYMAAKDEGHGFRKRSNQDAQREAETLFIVKTLGVK